MISPFLKWAGGKRWFVSRYKKLYPENFDRYIEPFLGGGASFFHLMPKDAVLADMNDDLMDTYRALRSNWAEVENRLERHALMHSDNYYYKVRNDSPTLLADKAARFIYLNRTCWNGLYRVNKTGKFNTPRGTRNSILFENDDFEAVADALSSAKLLVSDFEEVFLLAKENDFIFVDPPYTVKHNYNGFKRYNEKIFSWDDQERLSRSIRAASERGAKILLTNAAHDCVRDLFDPLGRRIPLTRKSLVAGSSASRCEVTEFAFVIGYRV